MEHFKRGHKVLFFPFPFGGGEGGGGMGAYEYINILTFRDCSYIFGGDNQFLMYQNDASFDYHSIIMNIFIHKRMSLETIKVKERQPGVTKHHQHKILWRNKLKVLTFHQDAYCDNLGKICKALKSDLSCLSGLDVHGT